METVVWIGGIPIAADAIARSAEELVSAWFEYSGAAPALIGVVLFGVIVSSPRA